jgi:hypothetical protein
MIHLTANESAAYTGCVQLVDMHQARIAAAGNRALPAASASSAAIAPLVASASEPPLNGMCTMSTPARSLNNSPARCEAEPAPVTLDVKDMRVDNILHLGVKELRSLARDPIMLFLIVYSFTVAVYSAATAMPESLTKAAIAIVDEDRSALSARITGAFFPPYFLPPVMISR